uniref:Nuclear pore complex protein Nup133 n=1 Tax=Caenorhabditis japonica TaxID=281687 RepID=A0A8R1DK49_CAEJA
MADIPPYYQFKMSAKDLELTLDKVPIEYPALVKEAFLHNWHASAHRTEVTSNCASLNDKYCWVLSRNQMFIWEKVKNSAHRASIPTQLPLPTSGLPRSVKCVVIYDGVHRGANKSPSPAVLVVSPEGVLRHWTSIESQNYVEKVLDINSEVALRVELADEPANGQSASFLLTTTSGTVFFLSGEGQDSAKTGSLAAHKVIGRDAHGFRRRLSSIMFGGVSKESTSLVTNSFQYQSNELLVVAVSPDVLTVYNMHTPSELWSLKTKDFFQPMVSGFFETDMKKQPMMVRSRLIDAAVFRGGLMVLVGATHDESQLVHMYTVWFGPDWQKEAPAKFIWSAKVPCTDHKALFSKTDESIYSNLTLCISQATAEAKSADRTDGVIILNPYFAISLYMPFNLENPKKNDISSYKVVALPANDQLIGYSIGKQYVYVMLLDSGVSTVRLLPRGFSDGTSMYTQEQAVPSSATGTQDWATLSELLSEMVAAGLPKSPILQSLHKSFDLFGEKNMSESAKELKPLVKMADQEMSRIVQQFMYAIIDYSDASNKTDTELHAKRVLTSRMILFLKHMGIFERILASPIPMSRGFQSGDSMLSEMSERVAATSAVWTWRNTNESNAAIFDAIIDKVLRIPEVQDLGLKDRDALFGRCGMFHHIPVIAAKQLDAKVLGKAKAHRFEVFHSVCDLLVGIKETILGWRSCRTKMAIEKPSKGCWTVDYFASCYKDVAVRIIEELREGTASDSERTRLLMYIISIYDFYLEESETQPDLDKVLQDLISLGKPSDAMELAEKHRDFGILVKNYLTTDVVTRQKTFERYKKAFEKEDFELYLCEYLKKHGKNDVLLQQRGSRVDAYLDNFKELRYSREIANEQYGKAALTLMSLADAETKSFSRFAEYLTRSFYCASTCKPDEGVDVAEVLDFFRRRLPEMRHRKRIPIEILKSGYGADLDVMMSVEEMLEWNMANQPNDEATIDGFARAFHLLADLISVHDGSVELRVKVDKTWKALLDYDEWNRIRSKDDVEKKTMFGKFCDYLINSYPSLSE